MAPTLDVRSRQRALIRSSKCHTRAGCPVILGLFKKTGGIQEGPFLKFLSLKRGIQVKGSCHLSLQSLFIFLFRFRGRGWTWLAWEGKRRGGKVFHRQNGSEPPNVNRWPKEKRWIGKGCLALQPPIASHIIPGSQPLGDALFITAI